jgi:hypothetical protein
LGGDFREVMQNKGGKEGSHRRKSGDLYLEVKVYIPFFEKLKGF